MSLESGEITYIPGTDKVILERMGLSPEDYFVIFDERHTTGTNIPMIPTAVAAMTLDESVGYSRALQAVMRMRQYAELQDLYVFISRELLTKFGLEDSSMESVVKIMVSAQTLQKSMIMFRSFLQKVDHVTGEMALGLLINAIAEKKSKDEVETIWESINSHVEYQTQDNPISLLNGDFSEINAREALVDRFQSRKNDFLNKLQALGIDKTSYAEIFTKELVTIKDQTDRCLFLNEMQKMSVQEGAEVMVQEERQIEREIENQQEIEQFLENINKLFKIPDKIPTQKKWTDGSALLLLRSVSGASLPISVLPFSSFCVDPFRICYEKFAHILDTELLCTENFVVVDLRSRSGIPIFHKASRPIKDLLLIKRGDNYQVILITLEETKFWREFLKTPRENVWLIDKHGKDLLDQPQLQKLLIQINALSGKVSYLLDHEKALLDWLNEDLRDKRKKIEMIKAAVVAFKDDAERHLFCSADLFFDTAGLTPLIPCLLGAGAAAAAGGETQARKEAECFGLGRPPEPRAATPPVVALAPRAATPPVVAPALRAATPPAVPQLRVSSPEILPPRSQSIVNAIVTAFAEFLGFLWKVMARVGNCFPNCSFSCCSQLTRSMRCCRNVFSSRIPSFSYRKGG